MTYFKGWNNSKAPLHEAMEDGVRSIVTSVFMIFWLFLIGGTCMFLLVAESVDMDAVIMYFTFVTFFVLGFGYILSAAAFFLAGLTSKNRPALYRGLALVALPAAYVGLVALAV